MLRTPNESVDDVMDQRPYSFYHTEGGRRLWRVEFEGNVFYENYFGPNRREYDPKDIDRQIRRVEGGFIDFDIEYCVDTSYGENKSVELEWADICRELGIWAGLKPETLHDLYGRVPSPGHYQTSMDILERMALAKRVEDGETDIFFPTDKFAERSLERGF